MKGKNISLNTLFNLSFLLVTILFIGFLIIGTYVYTTQENLVKNQSLRYQSYLLADELRQSSDDLTRLARTYVVTGNDKYEDMYFKILDIRNGKLNRPENYERIYWDLYVLNGQKPRPDSNIKEPLKELMKEAGFTEAEFAKLTEAENNSNGLVNTEVIAMDAVKGKVSKEAENMILEGENIEEFARRIMFDDDYHQNKGKIMKPVDEFFRLLGERTEANVLKYSNLQSYLLKATATFLLIMLILIVAVFVIIFRRIKLPLKEMPEVIEEVAKGNFTHKLKVRSDDELGRIANSFNEMVDNIHKLLEKTIGLIKELEGAINKIVASAENVSLSSEEVASAIEEISTGTSNVSQKALDSLESNNVLSENIQDVTNKIGEIAKKTEVNKKMNHQGVDSMEELGHKYEENIAISKKVGEGIANLTEKSSKVGGIVETINVIAEQTNLLALNAAIEAARAGDAGKGFAVVAEEIRKLAERSSDATLEIQMIISDITNIIGMTEKDMSNASNIVSQINETLGSTRRIYEGIIKSTNETMEEIEGVNNNINEIDKTKEITKLAIDEMASVSDETAASTHQIAKSVEGQVGAVKEINLEMGKLNNLIEELTKIVGEFEL